MGSPDKLVPTVGVLLAAGAGERMGRPKATVVLGGRTLLDRGLRMLHDGGCAHLIAVLGASSVPDGWYAATDFVANPDWETGMASSLRAGLAAATGAADVAAAVAAEVEAAVVALVDQPGITGEVVRRLRAAHQPGFAVAATFGGEIRTPVLFDRALWADVSAAVTGDAGARYWLRRNPDRVISVACDDVADPSDLDVPEDLNRWERACS